MTAKKEDIAENNQTRFRRAQAWLNQAKIWQRECKSACEAEAKDRLLCAEFISLWIAYDALSGRKYPNLSGVEGTKVFFREIENKCRAQEKFLRGNLEKLEDTIESLITLDKAYSEFWEERKSPPLWLNDEIRDSIRRNPITALRLIFERIYVVRNQVFHGAHTIGGSWGKEQVELSAAILRVIVPIIKRMMEESKADWKAIRFPRV